MFYLFKVSMGRRLLTALLAISVLSMLVIPTAMADLKNWETITDENGNVYEGDVLNGKRHGVGKMTFETDSYIGEWEDNMKSGFGVRTLQDGTRTTGSWQEDNVSGYCVQIGSDGHRLLGQMKSNKLDGMGVVLYSDGKIYLGEWIEHTKSGFGALIYEDGTTEIGVFENGVYIGKPYDEEAIGKYTDPDGNVYEGEMKDGKFNGYGRKIITDGRILEGYFSNGVFIKGYFLNINGYHYVGSFTDSKLNGVAASIYDGKVYVGDFVNDIREGEGALLWLDNEGSYIGGMAKNRLEGKGIYTRSEGDVYIGGFSNGEYEGEGVQFNKNGDIYEGGFVSGKRGGRGFLRYADGSTYEGPFTNGKAGN